MKNCVCLCAFVCTPKKHICVEQAKRVKFVGYVVLRLFHIYTEFPQCSAYKHQDTGLGTTPKSRFGVVQASKMRFLLLE